MFLPSRTPLGALALIFSPLISVQAVTTCYRQDNHSATNSIYTPCNNNIPFSMCYRSQVDAFGSPADKTCLPNGLVQNIDKFGDYQYWRDSCTDPTWTSPYCLNAFNACQEDLNSNAPVNPCGNDETSTTWCCGTNNTACCGTSGAITIAAVLGPSSTSSSFSTSATMASTSTAPSTINGFAKGAKAGIETGAAIGALAILGLITWMTIRIGKKKKSDMEGAAQLGVREVYPVEEFEAQQKTEKDYEARYEVYGHDDLKQYEVAPVEMG